MNEVDDRAYGVVPLRRAGDAVPFAVLRGPDFFPKNPSSV
jgi:hypothetical protein